MSANDVNTCVEMPDGTLLLSVHMRWRPQSEEAADPANLDPASGRIRHGRELGGEVVLRSADGGVSLIGLGRTVALCHRSSTSSQIRET